jgi:stress responsive alpha/beta barrel protein
MIAHVVLFKPRPGLDAEGRQRLAAAFEGALRDIPTIRRAQVGRRILHGRPYEQLMTVDYEYAAILEFDTLADLTAYLAHGAHDALGALFFEAFDVALMYDYEMEDARSANWLL